MKLVSLTNGAARSIKVGKRTITFKKTSPKNLLPKGEISSLTIQTLKTIGQNKVNDDTLKKLKSLLEKK
jgi:hypothetical protein